MTGDGSEPGLTKPQLKELLTAAMGEPCFPLILFLAWTGCRLGEALALRWSEVDFTRPQHVRIMRELRHGKEVPPATRFGRRSVGLPMLLVENMLALRSRLEGKDALVYQEADGAGVDSLQLEQALLRVSSRAGLPPVRPSTLRRSWAAIMLDAGLSPDFVSRSLGEDDQRDPRLGKT